MTLTSETFGAVIVVHSPEDVSADQAANFEVGAAAGRAAHAWCSTWTTPS